MVQAMVYEGLVSWRYGCMEHQRVKGVPALGGVAGVWVMLKMAG